MSENELNEPIEQPETTGPETESDPEVVLHEGEGIADDCNGFTCNGNSAQV